MNQKALSVVILFLIFLSLWGFNYYANQSSPPTPDLHFVYDVIDGDTIEIEDNIRVRLLAINAPEKGECYYEESREFLTDFLKSKQVRLEKDLSNTDQYDRLLRYVILSATSPQEDDILINDLLVRGGYAYYLASPPDNRYSDLLSSAQDEAKRARLGLWEKCLTENEAEALREEDEPPPNPNCLIKGNISEKGYGKTYLIPGCDNYNRVKIDFRKGERYFCTEEEAQEAGFRKATNCP